MVLSGYADPMTLFGVYFARAKEDVTHDPTAVALATTTRAGCPSVRMVLLKAIDERGLVFFTNYDSRKGHELHQNPQAAMCFYWPRIEVQVRAEGAVEKLSAMDSDAYFNSRARLSQIGAWASQQSTPLPSREILLQRVAEMESRFDGQPIPRPPSWGGFLLVPQRMEFWQGNPGRLHDRLVYEQTDGAWQTSRLFP
jgi:pyridoxamine 5'-phosphate oxidase